MKPETGVHHSSPMKTPRVPGGRPPSPGPCGPHPRRGLSRGRRWGKTISHVANKKGEVQEPAREQLLAEAAPLFRTVSSSVPNRNGSPASSREVKRGPPSRAGASPLKSVVLRSILSFAKQEAVWASLPCSPFSPSLSLGPPTFPFSA